jgi:hypothetical protein
MAEDSKIPDPAHFGDMAAGVMRAQARMMDAVMRQNIEALEFLKKRFEEDRKLLTQIAETPDGAKASAAWSDFWHRAMSDYTAEAGRMGSFAAATTEQMIEGLTEEARALAGGAPRRKG